MPDLDRKREYNREYQIRWRAANREKLREYNRRWRAANPDKANGKKRRWRDANREADLAKNRQRAHGQGIDAAVEAMWQEQQGCCYLCGNLLTRDQAVIEHDHACCPNGKSCRYCRRGLACQLCNSVIGFAHDDPDLLRKIAANLETVLQPVRDRIAGKPQQMEFLT